MIKWHIFLSTMALIVMFAAGLQAVLLRTQDYLLRHHKQQMLRFLPLLPPMETLEKYLFQTVSLGFILLAIVFISSLIFFGNVFTEALREKSILTLAALCVFAVLLWGRCVRGWRGRVAIHWTFLGVILLLILYCGTGLLLHAPH